MPPLSLNEIRDRALRFARNWAGGSNERAEAQTFWNEFFDVFGLSRRQVAAFENPVRSIRETYSRIDLFWKGRLLVEHKSRGANLDRAASQAFQYIQDLASTSRTEEIPRYVIVCDFERLVLYDLEAKGGTTQHTEIRVADLARHIKLFGFITGRVQRTVDPEDPANFKAAQLMAALHDAMAGTNYPPSDLERLLVRVLFCLFADDTGIFEAGQFETYVLNRTRDDGSDLGAQLNALFDVLNTPDDRRPSALDEELAAFPYVNGRLFEDRLSTAGFTSTMHQQLVQACVFDWSAISPAIFGSLFQGIMDPNERREIGAHYTSERDILKVIAPLFLDELRRECAEIKQLKRAQKDRIIAFQKKLAALRFFDTACGCGNFLVIAYRELRRMEHELVPLLRMTGEDLSLGEEVKQALVDVDQFYGIEVLEWPARIAETALWLMDHQMNSELSELTGNLFQRIPLRESPTIACGNALRMDWNQLLPAAECAYVFGNPPFIGAKFQSDEQRDDVAAVAGGVHNVGLLDYVTMWYFKAADYMRLARHVRCAFVSTNSIAQGEQAGVIWEELFRRGVKIRFAHQTFAWQSEARGMAHVHVVIVGFGLDDAGEKIVFEYPGLREEPHALRVRNISPYLVEGGDVVVTNRRTPLCDVPEIGIGNKPIDGGHYLFDDAEKAAFLKLEPGARKFFRPWIGSDEFINGYHRWCLWLGDAPPHELSALPECRKRIEAVRKVRQASKSAPTRKLALTPTRFHVENFPTGKFLVIPKVSSERRPYIPIGYLSPKVLVSDLCFISNYATPFHFGVLTSAMHMAWVRRIGGRLKSDYRYSAKLVYNNFPWPQNATPAQKAKVEEAAGEVLEVRKGFLAQGSTLADLYDPEIMPAALRRAHEAVDRAVDRCYRGARFASERERIEYLLGEYEKLMSPLAGTAARGKKRRK